MLRDPTFLSRKAHRHEKNLRAAARDFGGYGRIVGRREVSVSRARDDERRMTGAQRLRRARRGVALAAEQRDRHARARERGAERIDQLDAGHALVDADALQARREQDADRIAECERAVREHRAICVVALRVHDHLGADRHDERRLRFAREGDDRADGIGHAERIDATPEDGRKY